MKRMSERIDKDIREPFESLRERVDTITGTRSIPIKKLGPTSSLEDCIRKINEIIDRLQTQ